MFLVELTRFQWYNKENLQKGGFILDITIIISLITAVAAILAPVLTAFINTRHEQKMKKLEMFELTRIKVISNYISSAEKYIDHTCEQYRLDFGECCNQIYLYTPKQIWNIIDDFNMMIQNKELDNARILLPQLTKKLSPYIRIFENPQ